MGTNMTTEYLPQITNDVHIADELIDIFFRKNIWLNENFDTAAGPDYSLEQDVPPDRLENFQKSNCSWYKRNLVRHH